MRDYLSVSEASKKIAGEVLEFGVSKNWAPVDQNSIDLAKDLEKYLSKFNIGYTDNKSGTWSHRRDGTRYFSALDMMSFAKGKLNNFISSLKK